MWLVGLVVLTLVVAIAAALMRRTRDPAPEIWDIPGTARTYTTIVGTLAGFSVTSTIFIANLSVAQQASAFESVIAHFLIAFLLFISAAMQFGTTPNLTKSDTTYVLVQRYSYLLANASYYLALTLSWLGLPLLLSAIGLGYFAEVFSWLVLFAVLGGGSRLAGSGLSVLAGLEYRSSLALPFVAFAAALVYREALAPRLPGLIPTERESLSLAVACFVVGALGFTIQSLMVSSLRNHAPRVERYDVMPRLLAAYLGAVFVVTALLWLANRRLLTG